MRIIPSVVVLGMNLVVVTILHLGSNEFGAQLKGGAGVVVIDGLGVLKVVDICGGKYVAGSAVGVGFGQRGSKYPGPHCKGTTNGFDAQFGSNEPMEKI